MKVNRRGYSAKRSAIAARLSGLGVLLRLMSFKMTDAGVWDRLALARAGLKEGGGIRETESLREDIVQRG